MVKSGAGLFGFGVGVAELAVFVVVEVVATDELSFVDFWLQPAVMSRQSVAKHKARTSDDRFIVLLPSLFGLCQLQPGIARLAAFVEQLRFTEA
jgi:hypothetical protein